MDRDHVRYNDEPIGASVGYGLARLGRGLAWAGFWIGAAWAFTNG